MDEARGWNLESAVQVTLRAGESQPCLFEYLSCTELNMKTKTIYICVKAKVEIPDVLPEDVEDVEDAINLVVNELDYSLSYDQDGIRLIDTEIMGLMDEGI